MSRSPLIAVDFFCGAGGFTRGLLNAGIQVVLGVDINPECKDTYERNNRPAKFLCKNVWDVREEDMPQSALNADKRDLLFVGCAPCQPFSKQKKRVPNRSGRRVRELDGTLLMAFAKAIERFQPGHILVENVPGLIEVPGNSTYHRFVRTLQRLNYKIDKGIVDAKRYGVPQKRRRFILVASRVFQPALPEATHGPGKRPYVTVREAISHYPPIEAGESHPQIPNHFAAGLTERNLNRLKNTSKDGGSRLGWTDDLTLDCHKGDYDGHTDVYGRMWWDRPAPTLTCRCGSISNGRYGHPDQNRAISFREAARLQTFPDDFYFICPSALSLGELIGNAVPVKLAEKLGRTLVKQRAAASTN